jgi:hypothetical protein
MRFSASYCDAGKAVAFTCNAGAQRGWFTYDGGPDAEIRLSKQAIHAFAANFFVCG